MGRYERPDSLDAAIELQRSGRWTVLAGGTDHYPARVGDRVEEDVLDLSGITSLRGISETTDGGWRIGATTTWTDIVRAALPSAFDGLKAAAREVGGIQIQNRGTIAGNLCNASPAADGVPPLLTLNASVEVTRPDGVEIVALSDFILGNRKTLLTDDALVSAVLVPKQEATTTSAFHKLGARKYLVISIAMVSALVSRAPDGSIGSARVAVGACSAVARRLPAVETALSGARNDQVADRLADLVQTSGTEALGLSPIDDVRGSAEYRQEIAVTLIARAVTEALDLPKQAA